MTYLMRYTLTRFEEFIILWHLFTLLLTRTHTRSFWSTELYDVNRSKTMRLHTIFALIASIFIRDVFQINLNYFIFILILNLCAKHNRMNAHSYEHIWCIQNTDAQKKYRTKRLENGPDVVISSKLICFFLKTHAHKRKEKERGREDERNGRCK